jgi:uncharacterized protein YvpB
MRLILPFCLIWIVISMSSCSKQGEGIVVTTPVKQDTILPSVGPYVKEVPYYYQYNNTLEPAATCQNTCIAMVLKYFATKEGKTSNVVASITPDAITKKYGHKKAQTVAGLQEVFNQEAGTIGIQVRGTGSTTMSLDAFKAKAANASPLIVHGYFTDFGHILVVLGYDGTHYICNDPAGKWSQKYKFGGYSGNNDTEGLAVKYEKEVFEKAISPDGMVWVHTYK